MQKKRKALDQRLYAIFKLVIWNRFFLGAQAKRGASNSLILPEDNADQQGKTSAFLPLRETL